MSLDGIDVVLTVANHDIAQLRELAQRELAAAERTSNEIDLLETKLARLAAEGPSPTRQAHRRSGHEPLSAERQLTWDELRAQAEVRLQERGVDPAQCDIDALLDPAEVDRIERRALGGYDMACKLDHYDLLAALAAGLAAAAVDALVVRIPRDLRWKDHVQRGSWLTRWLRDQAIPSDNWLADIAEVPYDAMRTADGTPIPGMGPRTHRVQSFGHDPLLGLILGTVDIMRGTITGVGTQGMFLHESGGGTGANPIEAFALQVLHLMSDLPTRAGLPVPGWAVISSISAGEYEGRTPAEWSRLMHLRGYDTWHFMSMATVPATVHLVLRAYWALRQELDEDFAAQVATERGPTGDSVSGHPHFDSLLLAGHAVAAGGNLAKLAAYGGNPVALNYNQWLAFFRAAFDRMSNPGPSASERLASQSDANAYALADGWVDLAQIDLGSWPGSE